MQAHFVKKQMFWFFKETACVTLQRQSRGKPEIVMHMYRCMRKSVQYPQYRWSSQNGGRTVREKNDPVTMREVASDPITAEQGCRWRKGCVKSEDGPIMIK